MFGYFLTWTFSISRNAGPFKDETWFEIFSVCDQTFSLNFLTLSGLILFISRQRTTPFWRTSAKSPSGSFSSRTASIHWNEMIVSLIFNIYSATRYLEDLFLLLRVPGSHLGVWKISGYRTRPDLFQVCLLCRERERRERYQIQSMTIDLTGVV